jgi:hypothetical protein
VSHLSTPLSRGVATLATHLVNSTPHRLAAAGLLALVLTLTATLLPATPAQAISGRLTLTPGASAVTVGGVRLSSGKAKLNFTVPALSPGAHLAFAVVLRERDPRHAYRAKVTISSDGRLKLSLVRLQNGALIQLAGKTLATKVRPGQKLWIQGKISGSRTVSLAARSWVQGRKVPTWQTRATDRSSHRLTRAAVTRGWVKLSAKATKSVSTSYTGLATTGTRTAPTATTVAAPTSVTRTAAVVGKRSSANTGVPKGLSLKKHTGNITVTKAGTVLDRMDIHGFVTVKAPNVTISRSIVRGGKARNNTGLITNYGYSNLVVKDTTLKANHPSVWLDGLKGWNFTALRVHIVGNVDSVKIQGSNVSIRDSLLENTTYYKKDPNQGGRPTHNDNVQILKGDRITISGNTIRGAQNFAILAAANHGNTTNLVVRNNWLDGGHCTLKLQRMGGRRLTATVTGNTFGPNRRVRNCPFQAEPGVSVSHSGNVLAVGGKAVTPLRKR